MHKRKRIVVLGATGSIGRQTLDVVREHADKLEIIGLGAGHNQSLLRQQAELFSPQYLALADHTAAKQWSESLHKPHIPMFCGAGSMEKLVELPGVDLVVNAVSGFAGLSPTLKALRLGLPVAIANKEPIVAAGHLIIEEAKKFGGTIIPIDSEPSAIMQCMQGEGDSVHKLIITASGGPFYGWKKEELAQVSPARALTHPNWRMGPKITIDSATLMNKGLEVIEAHWLFAVDYPQIEVVVQPRSFVHSLVEFQDGSLLAHLGQPDMRIPIQYALSYPERWPSPWPRLRLVEDVNTLVFQAPDTQTFPCLDLARAAGVTGGSLPTVLSGADEEAVHLFLQEKIRFLDIPLLVEKAMSIHPVMANPDLEAIQETDAWVRRWVQEQI